MELHALANAACRQGKAALYQRLPRLFEDLVIARGEGRQAKLMTGLGRVDVLIMDDLGLALLDDERRRDFPELQNERYQARSTIIISQLPISAWHDSIVDPTLADAILDRLVHNAHTLNLMGESLRKHRPKLTSENDQE